MYSVCTPISVPTEPVPTPNKHINVSWWQGCFAGLLTAQEFWELASLRLVPQCEPH